jgi:23S rRNA pseudouridine1911/1915/1917 synthase
MGQGRRIADSIVVAERLDVFLVRTGWAQSRRHARELIGGGLVSVGGRPGRKGDTVAPGADVQVANTPLQSQIQPNSDLSVEVLFEDSALLVVNKPGSVPCHPLHRSERDTVLNAVVAVYPEVAEAGERPLEGGLVHRLDNGTSGALIIARTKVAHTKMRTAIRSGQISRSYLALCAGKIANEIEVATPIAHHLKNPRRMVTIQPGDRVDSKLHARPAATQIVPLENWRESTLIEVRPRTGSRHQIRIHLASIGHPLIGDALYGGPVCEALEPGRFWLHLSELRFESPASGEVTVAAPLPGDLTAVLKRFENAE